MSALRMHRKCAESTKNHETDQIFKRTLEIFHLFPRILIGHKNSFPHFYFMIALLHTCILSIFLNHIFVAYHIRVDGHNVLGNFKGKKVNTVYT